MRTEFVEEPLQITIKGGYAILSWSNGERRSVPYEVLKVAHERVGKAIAEYEAKSADVIPIKRGRAKRE